MTALAGVPGNIFDLAVFQRDGFPSRVTVMAQPKGQPMQVSSCFSIVMPPPL